MSAGGLSKTRLARVTDCLTGYVERGEVAGVLSVVCRHGEAHVAAVGAMDTASAAPMRQDTIFRVMSMTKPVLAVAALMLVEERRLRLDAPLDPWLPELANRKVLRSIHSALDDVTPADRAITLRDLLTCRFGLGAIMALPGSYPIQAAMSEMEIAPGPDPVPWAPDAFMKKLEQLPLIHQPGERWMYHTSFDVLAVLLARAADQPLEDLLTQRLFTPLDMKDTAFSVPTQKLDRLATCYRPDGSVYDPARGGSYASPPVFPAQLASTADDYLAFALMLLAMGRHRRKRIVSRPALELMLTDHITPGQKQASPFFPGFWESNGWGFGVAITTRRDTLGANPGRYGWNGGLGTTWINDPREDMTVLVLRQKMMAGPDDTALADDVITLAYQAIDD